MVLERTIDGELVETTPEHPFFVEGTGWVQAGALVVGDVIHSAGGVGVVEALESVASPRVMYNLTVAEAHTFHVGQGQWLVHNACSSRILGNNLVKNGVARPPNTAAHHIVAGNAPGAAQARQVLAREGIDINDAANGVFLPKNRNVPNPTGANVHSTLHTNRYYAEVNRRIINAAPGTVRDVLAQIRRELEAGTFPY